MSSKPDYERGFRDGIRTAVTWLHNLSDEMNDHHARIVLNMAAFNLGSDYSPRRLKRTKPAGDTPNV